MKHTEVYGLRNRGTRDTIKGTLATMEAGGEDGHGIRSTPTETPPPMDPTDDVRSDFPRSLALMLLYNFASVLLNSC